MTAYIDAMRRYFDFKSRASRTEFWMFTLVICIGGIVAVIADAAMGNGRTNPPIITALWVIPHYIPSLAVTVRRLHDTGRSGWWVLVGLVPVVGWVVVLVFACLPSMATPNQFGNKTISRVTGAVGAGRDIPARRAQIATTLPAGEHSAGAGGSRASAPLAELERLAALRASGVIDEAEFARLKAAVMNQSST